MSKRSLRERHLLADVHCGPQGGPANFLASLRERVLWPSRTRAALFLGALWMLMCAQLWLGDFCMGRLGRAFEEPFFVFFFFSTSVPNPRGVRNTTSRHVMAERDAPSWVSAPPRRLRWRLRRAINQHPKEGRREGTRTHMEDVREERGRRHSYLKGRGAQTAPPKGGRRGHRHSKKEGHSIPLTRVGSESTLTLFFVEFWRVQLSQHDAHFHVGLNVWCSQTVVHTGRSKARWRQLCFDITSNATFQQAE